MPDEIPMTDHPSIVVASEAIQREAWYALSRTASPSMSKILGIDAKLVGSTLYHGALKVPGAQFNKIFSFGLKDDVSDETVEAAADWLENRYSGQALMMVPPSACYREIDSKLIRAGFRRYPFDMTIFHLDADDVRIVPRPPNIEIHQVTSSNTGTFGQVLSEALGVEQAKSWLAAYAAQETRLTAYMAYEGSTPIGAAELFIDGDCGWLFIAAVRPAYRNRGAQTALLARRIADGKAAGVRTFTAGFLYPAAGRADEFQSSRNMLRFGMKPSYNRANYTWPSRNEP